jgi:RimJ/RimL family protein N-acetyltransferase
MRTMAAMLIPRPDPPLQDDVVALRPWTIDDAPAVAAACQDPEIPRWTMVPTPYLEDDAREFLAHVARKDLEDQLNMAMTRADDGTLIGSITLFIVKPAVAEFGYWAAPETRGRGYTPRALRLFAQWALDELKLPRLQLGTLPGNSSSERVAEKVGFRREGVLRSYLDQRGERRDVLMWSLLPGELR